MAWYYARVQNTIEWHKCETVDVFAASPSRVADILIDIVHRDIPESAGTVTCSAKMFAMHCELSVKKTESPTNSDWPLYLLGELRHPFLSWLEALLGVECLPSIKEQHDVKFPTTEWDLF